MTDDPATTWTEPCGDTTPELARIQQIARQLRDPRYGDRDVETVQLQGSYLCPARPAPPEANEPARPAPTGTPNSFAPSA